MVYKTHEPLEKTEPPQASKMNTLVICVLAAALCAGEVYSSHSQYYGATATPIYSHGYHGPTAVPHVLHDGHIADTHEVAAAKAEHYAAVAKAQVHGGYGQDYSGQYASGYGGYDGYSHLAAPYHGPLAKPVVLHNGYLADTHEVAAAKAEHLSAIAKAKALGGYSHDYNGQYTSGYGGYHRYSQNGQYSSGYGAYNGYSHHAAPYHGPLAKPVVLHNGYLADTHEVAAAKAEHHSAVAKAKAHGGHSNGYSGQYTSGYGGYHGYSQNGQYASGYGAYNGYSHHAAPYHGPLAKPVVLHNGYLADTHEVAAAKQQHLQALHSRHHGSDYGHY